MNNNPGGGGILLAHVQQAAARRGREWARRTFRQQLADGVLRPGMMFQSAPSPAMIKANNAGAAGDAVVADLQALATIAGAATEWSRLHTDWLRDQRASFTQRMSAERWEVARMVSTRSAEKIHLGVVMALSLPGGLGGGAGAVAGVGSQLPRLCAGPADGGARSRADPSGAADPEPPGRGPLRSGDRRGGGYGRQPGPPAEAGRVGHPGAPGEVQQLHPLRPVRFGERGRGGDGRGPDGPLRRGQRVTGRAKVVAIQVAMQPLAPTDQRHAVQLVLDGAPGGVGQVTLLVDPEIAKAIRKSRSGMDVLLTLAPQPVRA